MGMSAQEMVNIGLYRYGKPTVTAEARAEFLKYLNLAQRALWSAGDWQFKRKQGTLVFVNGTREYALDASASTVFWMRNASKAPMTNVPQRTFNALYWPDTTTGVPTRYTLVENALTAGPPLVSALKVSVWPVPSAAGAGNGIYSYESAVADLTDSATSESAIPDKYRGTVVSWALMLLSAQQKNEMVAVYKAEVDSALERMHAQIATDEVRRK